MRLTPDQHTAHLTHTSHMECDKHGCSLSLSLSRTLSWHDRTGLQSLRPHSRPCRPDTYICPRVPQTPQWGTPAFASSSSTASRVAAWTKRGEPSTPTIATVGVHLTLYSSKAPAVAFARLTTCSRMRCLVTRLWSWGLKALDEAG